MSDINAPARNHFLPRGVRIFILLVRFSAVWIASMIGYRVETAMRHSSGAWSRLAFLLVGLALGAAITFFLKVR